MFPVLRQLTELFSHEERPLPMDFKHILVSYFPDYGNPVDFSPASLFLFQRRLGRVASVHLLD